MVSFSKIYKNDPRERACFSFSTVAIVLFLFLGVYSAPPRIGTLAIAHAKIIEIASVKDKKIVKFADEKGQTLECVGMTGGWKCPVRDLDSAFQKNSELMLWHNQKTIYQIKQGDKWLLTYSRWERESNIAYAVALFWVVLLVARLTPLFLALIKHRTKR